MDMINAGVLSILPPVIAIVLALITKEVVSSLMIGILSGAFIYSTQTGGGIIKAMEVTFSLMTEKIGANANIILFLALLGALVVVVTKAGGSRAYGEWASKKIKSKNGAQLCTSLLGSLIFIDDYFNCLTVGTVMKPVTDKYKISREKLAYIIDATAAPVCIIAPVSSWAAAIISQIESTGIADPMGAFVSTIPFNLYAILTIIMVIVLCTTNLEFGPMAKYESDAERGITITDDSSIEIEGSSKGRVYDLLIPIGSLIVFSVLSMLYVGGLFDGSGMSIAQAFGNTDASVALVYGGFGSLLISLLLFVPRKVLSFKDFMEGIVDGIKSMTAAIVILTLAWSISGVCRDLLGTGYYVGDLVKTSNLPLMFIPAIVFLVAAFLSFSMGTAWGTFGILIPIVVIVVESGTPQLLIISLAATLAGSVFGDHCSPISDTTILSSTGAGCKHINHVSSQIPYACVVASCSFVGYLIAGFTSSMNLFVSAGITLVSSLLLLFVTLIIMHRRNSNKTAGA